jgi:DNA replication protein DnaC
MDFLNNLNAVFFDYSNKCLNGGYVPSKQAEAVLSTIKNCKKGVILYGRTGTGKTLILELLMRLIHPQDKRKFMKAYSLDKVIEFNTTGHDLFLNNRDKNLWFDDLGAEGKGSYYGDKFEVMERMIQIRYDLYRNGILTHFTTNLSPNEIKARYGERAWSRLTEMCEHVVFDGEDKRNSNNFIGFIPVNHKPIKTKEELEWEENYNKRREEIAKTENYAITDKKGIGTLLKQRWEELGLINNEKNDL